MQAHLQGGMEKLELIDLGQYYLIQGRIRSAIDNEEKGCKSIVKHQWQLN